MQQQPAPPPAQADNGKTTAILAYCTLIGFIIAIVMHSSNKTRLGAYHLRQALGLFISWVAIWIVMFIIMMLMPFLFFVMPLIALGFLVLLILGIVNAANEKETPVPLIGSMFEKMFGGAFN
ncbi:MAG: hypothetical protein FD123_2295 [Bacteroidetes bacterium]|nr:MAG: hypothetical protein FD123_2295 [Bacteroidota bacterium]